METYRFCNLTVNIAKGLNLLLLFIPLLHFFFFNFFLTPSAWFISLSSLLTFCPDFIFLLQNTQLQKIMLPKGMILNPQALGYPGFLRSTVPGELESVLWVALYSEIWLFQFRFSSQAKGLWHQP